MFNLLCLHFHHSRVQRLKFLKINISWYFRTTPPWSLESMLERHPLRFLGYSQVRKMSDLKLKVCPCSCHNLGYYTLVSTLPSTWKVSKLRREVGGDPQECPSLQTPQSCWDVLFKRGVHLILFPVLSLWKGTVINNDGGVYHIPPLLHYCCKWVSRSAPGSLSLSHCLLERTFLGQQSRVRQWTWIRAKCT